MTKKPATLKDVAASAGVSLAMASRVLSKYGSYSNATRERVETAAHELSYRANGVARSLRLQRTNSVGVLISQIASYHWTTFVQGVEEAARQAGYHVILCNTNDDPKRELEYLAEMRERGVDGIIASPLAANHRAFKQLGPAGFPAVVVNAQIAGSKLVHITSDDRSAAVDAVRHLADFGHRRIGIVAGPQEFETGRARLGGYRDALKQLGMPEDETLIAYGDFKQVGGYEATRSLIGLPTPPTAILVCSELMSGGVLRCLKDHGVRIPDEMSVIAFDDPDWASFFTPSMSCLREERFYMGKLAFDALVANIEDRASPAGQTREIVLKSELIQRESVAAPRTNTRQLDQVLPSDMSYDTGAM
ncbi:LacI family DNA-binding transcriptional regulator [Devosia rhodophyticola]|uniref:LacI family DNA-binding transcriptional regulator n=1 Tax=Devosia rhodophyticola TaxID=3026423 RepID=A0ABY7YUC1_9HYPH|nr:LacI family DNA-binding transcriptional regulator [Devosia rhodophyticola]WDR04645.1 LacI family DNA-binding transcriptional regulator [Devosia rhodophyticola]